MHGMAAGGCGCAGSCACAGAAGVRETTGARGGGLRGAREAVRAPGLRVSGRPRVHGGGAAEGCGGLRVCGRLRGAEGAVGVAGCTGECGGAACGRETAVRGELRVCTQQGTDSALSPAQGCVWGGGGPAVHHCWVTAAERA